jgi:hypothetical protein
MSKSKKSTGAKLGVAQKKAVSGSFQDRNLMGTSPLKEQFEPTDACPIRQRNKMAGGS